MSDSNDFKYIEESADTLTLPEPEAIDPVGLHAIGDLHSNFLKND